jgi:lysozyme
MFVKGVDVSEFSEAINWEELKDQGIKFAYARAIYGTVKTDDKFHTYWPAMKEHNIIRGAYMFFRPANDLDTQVRLFAQAVDMDAGDLPPAVDLEFEQDRHGNEISLWPQLSTRASIDLVATLLQSVERTIGYKPVIYANHDFWTNQMGDTSRFSHDYDLWIANFPRPENQPLQLFGEWNIHTFHQYKGDIPFQGIEGDVDLDTFNGDIDRLKAEAVPDIAIQEGRIGPKVKELQKRLTKIAKDPNRIQPDLDPQSIDVIFGPNTKKAVIAFQKTRNLPPTGQIKLEEFPA